MGAVEGRKQVGSKGAEAGVRPQLPVAGLSEGSGEKWSVE